MVVIILPFYNVHMDKKKRRLEEERRLMSTKLAAPVRENYLNELMADYSMVSKGFGSVCAFEGFDCAVFILLYL